MGLCSWGLREQKATLYLTLPVPNSSSVRLVPPSDGHELPLDPLSLTWSSSRRGPLREELWAQDKIQEP